MSENNQEILIEYAIVRVHDNLTCLNVIKILCRGQNFEKHSDKCCDI